MMIYKIYWCYNKMIFETSGGFFLGLCWCGVVRLSQLRVSESVPCLIVENILISWTVLLCQAASPRVHQHHSDNNSDTIKNQFLSSLKVFIKTWATNCPIPKKLWDGAKKSPAASIKGRIACFQPEFKVFGIKWNIDQEIAVFCNILFA